MGRGLALGRDGNEDKVKLAFGSMVEGRVLPIPCEGNQNTSFAQGMASMAPRRLMVMLEAFGSRRKCLWLLVASESGS